MEIQNNKNIKEIKKHIESGDLSLIIGAGFSKNISQQYPNWDELLRPMILEMYSNLIPNSSTKKEKTIQNIINKTGYLEIASEYIRRKGYHEALDVYIEKNMPYLIKQPDDTYLVMCNNKVVDNKPNMECHQKLIGLGVKNIYTFNYDNALDICGNTDIAEQNLKKQIKAEDLKKNLSENKDDYESIYRSLQMLKEDENSIDKKDSIDGKVSKPLSFIASVNNEINRINVIINEYGLSLKNFFDNCNKNEEDEIHNFNIEIFKEAIAKQESIINEAIECRKELYQLITNAFQISLTESMYNIYKLHGNLRINRTETFGFDGDSHKQYVICKEDYDGYPEKHEAFVNLMKISLLKGSFCLIGFSGNDPNFLMWINWVKDVLNKNNKESNNKHIFYIHVGNDLIPEDKLLLLNNHYITPIILNSIFPEAKNPSEQMLTFLEKIAPDKEKYLNYNKIWNTIDIKGNNDSIIIQQDHLHSIDKLYSLTPFNRIPEQTNFARYGRFNILQNASELIKQHIYPKETAKLIYSAIKGELLPIDYIIANDEINTIIQSISNDMDMEEKFKLLMLRSDVLRNKGLSNFHSKTNDEKYEDILSQLFNLQFDEVKNKLDLWNPIDGVNKMRRLMLLSIFDKSNVENEINNSQFNTENYECIQDCMYALELLPQVRGTLFQSKSNKSFSFDEDIHNRKEELKNQNPDLNSIWKVMELLVKGMLQKKDIQPYGNKIYSVRYNSYDEPIINSIKLLQVFLEVGLPTHSTHIRFLEGKDWLLVFKNVFELYPYPCLYFSLLYGNSNELIRTIAQEYIYNTKLRSILPKILNKILKASLYVNCPMKIKDAIYIASPIFMRAVPSDLWIDSFKTIYNSFNFCDINPNRAIIDPVYNFMTNSVELINDIEFKHKIVNDCLSKGINMDNFYNNLIIAASSGIETFDEGIKQKIAKLIDDATMPAHFYVLLNMSKLLDQQMLCNKFLTLADKVYNDPILLVGVSRFAKDYPELKVKLRDIVINSTLLWQTGIMANYSGVSKYCYSIDINIIQKNIGFEKNQIDIIYSKMTAALNDIVILSTKWRDKESWNFLNNWIVKINEMKQFMLYNKKALYEKNNYNESRKTLVRLYDENRGGNNVRELLVDDTYTNNAIGSLVSDISTSGVTKYQYEYSLLAFKIIMRNSKHLNSCFRHFGWALITYQDQFDRKRFKPIIKDILKLYQAYFKKKNAKSWDIEFAEKDVVEKELLNIYKVYSNWGGKYVFWSNYKPLYLFSHIEN